MSLSHQKHPSTRMPLVEETVKLGVKQTIIYVKKSQKQLTKETVVHGYWHVATWNQAS